MTWVRLVNNNIQRRVRGTVDQLQTLIGVLVHDYGHAGNEHENGWYRYLTIVTVVQDYNRLLFRGFSIFPLMFRNEDPEKCLLLVLERECGLKI